MRMLLKRMRKRIAPRSAVVGDVAALHVEDVREQGCVHNVYGITIISSLPREYTP